MTTREWKEPINYIAPNDDSVAEGIEVREEDMAGSVEEGKASPQMQVAKMWYL